MTTLDLPLRHPLVGHARPGRTRDRVAAFAAPYLARRRRRHDLARLPDYALRDLGVDPEAIRGPDYGLNMALLLNNLR
ncbi:DUF1127 domain-containing protein [Devosia sp.]|uniref:DUF1127 domain-containing protein n=1 Tax=Devosia sp. TaxID=1871048 RepID=UPI002EE0701B